MVGLMRISSDEEWNRRLWRLLRIFESKEEIRKELCSSSSSFMEVATGGTQRRDKNAGYDSRNVSNLGSTRRDALWMRSDDSDRVDAVTTNIGDDVPAFQR